MLRVSTTAILVPLLLLFNTVTYAESKYYGTRLCQNNPTEFTCYNVKKGETWDSVFPDPQQQDIVKRVNRLGNRIHKGTILAVPINLSENSQALEYSPFPQTMNPPGEKVILVSLKQQAWGAYDSVGTLVKWGPISSAKGYCPDINKNCRTPPGKFAIYRKGNENCKSTIYPVGRGGAPMPYCMFFNGGFALHGSYDIPGYNASHGCVRLMVDDAQWLNEDFTEGEGNVPVIVSAQ